jgi:hypothetical protein
LKRHPTVCFHWPRAKFLNLRAFPALGPCHDHDKSLRETGVHQLQHANDYGVCAFIRVMVELLRAVRRNQVQAGSYFRLIS